MYMYISIVVTLNNNNNYSNKYLKHILEINKELIIIIPKQSLGKDKMNKERVMAVYNFGAPL
jgi:hypothetical protein